MGDSIDNIKGVPGIGEKGARDLIAQYGSLDALLAHAGEVTQKRYREGLLAHADDARQSRELATIRTDVPVAVRPRGASGIAAPRASAASSCSRGSASARWCTEYAPTADDDRQGLRDSSRSLDELHGAGRRAARRRPLRLRVLPDGTVGDARALVGLAVLDRAAARRATCRSATAALRRRLRALRRVATALALLRAAARAIRVDREGRPRPEVRRDRARRGTASTLARPRHRHDAGQLPARRERARATRSRTVALEQLGYKALTEEDVCGNGAKAMSFARAAGRQRARLRRRARRPRAAAAPNTSAAARAATG